LIQDGNYLRNALKSDENEDDRFTEASFAALTDQKVGFYVSITLKIEVLMYCRRYEWMISNFALFKVCLEEVNRNLTKNIQDAARELDFLQVLIIASSAV
jgi:hypothetical protein